MKTINRYLVLLTLSAIFSTVAYAGDVVKDTLGTTASSAQAAEVLLQGQVAGVRVWSQDGSQMSASGVSIRGVNSLRGGQQPLYVVDGTILNDSNTKNIDPLWQYGDVAYASPLSQLSFLTPNDIESIEVLKNTSATALYGSKGANGVVIITTKKIKDERSVISWDSNVGFANPLMNVGGQAGISHNHKVMVGGTKNKSTYTLSGYFRDDNYVIPGTGSIKGGLRTSFETQANPVVWFGFNSNLNVGKINSAAATQWYGQESMTLSMRNPEASIDGWAADYDDHALDFRAVNSMWLKLNLAKGFSFKMDVGADYQFNRRSFWGGEGTPFGAQNNGAAAILNTSSFAFNASGVFNYNVYLAQKHHLNVSVGAQALGSWDVFNTMNGMDFYNHYIRYRSLNFAASKAQLYNYNRKMFSLGVFGNISYDYDGIVGVDLAYRTDLNPEFGSWNMYPSASAYWDVRRTFFADSDVVSALRLEGGYGESGKDDIMAYEFLGDYTVGEYIDVDPNATSFFDGRSYIHSKEWNVALTFGLFDNRLSVTAGYYQRQTSDILSIYSKGEEVVTQPEISDEEEEGNESEDGEDDTPAFVPEHRFWKIADRKEVSSQESVVANKGIELSLTAVPVRTKDWTWSITANAAYNYNRIAKLAVEDQGGMAIGHYTVGEGDEAQTLPVIATSNIEGQPVSSIVDAEGNVLGNSTPEYYGGLGTTLRWKDLSLDVLADGAADYNIVNLNKMARAGKTAVSGTYVDNGDFLRLARVSLAYNIPMKNVKWIESFKVFATATNLAVWTYYGGWSPDVNSYAASNFRLGMDYGSYPAARSFVLGLSIKF